MKGKRPIELHIEELVLRGLPPGAGDGLGAALEEELSRLIEEGGLPAVFAGMEEGGRGPLHLPGGQFTVDPRGGRAGSIGAQVAREIHQSWTEPKP
jgi:hypothetical protein